MTQVLPGPVTELCGTVRFSFDFNITKNKNKTSHHDNGNVLNRIFVDIYLFNTNLYY
jgi:hypothetical protein